MGIKIPSRADLSPVIREIWYLELFMNMFASVDVRVLEVAVWFIMSKNWIKWLRMVVSYFGGQVYTTAYPLLLVFKTCCTTGMR